eukprot:gene8639-10633_t
MVDCDYTNNQVHLTGYSDNNCTQIIDGPNTYKMGECFNSNSLESGGFAIDGIGAHYLYIGGNEFNCVSSLPDILLNTTGTKTYQTTSCDDQPNPEDSPQHLIYYPTGICLPLNPPIFAVDSLFKCNSTMMTMLAFFDIHSTSDSYSSYHPKNSFFLKNSKRDHFHSSNGMDQLDICPGSPLLDMHIPLENRLKKLNIKFPVNLPAPEYEVFDLYDYHRLEHFTKDGPKLKLDMTSWTLNNFKQFVENARNSRITKLTINRHTPEIKRRFTVGYREIDHESGFEKDGGELRCSGRQLCRLPEFTVFAFENESIYLLNREIVSVFTVFATFESATSRIDPSLEISSVHLERLSFSIKDLDENSDINFMPILNAIERSFDGSGGGADHKKYL